MVAQAELHAQISLVSARWAGLREPHREGKSLREPAGADPNEANRGYRYEVLLLY